MNLKKSKIKTWEIKIESICSSYEKYIENVYHYNANTGDCNCLDNTSSFIKKMEESYSYKDNYSLHL